MNKCYKCRWWNFSYGCQSKYKCKFEPFDKDTNVRSKYEPKLSEIPTSKCHYEPKDEPQMITMVKDHGRKQALEMIDLYHELKTEP